MLTKRIIPCLDVTKNMTVKGINFENIVEIGDPIKLGKKYYLDGADELVFLDITATNMNENIKPNLVRNIAKEVFIPFTIGGGISSINDIKVLLRNGADKVTINTAAIKSPSLIKTAANFFGSQCIVVSIDVKIVDGRWIVFTNGGKFNTNIEVSKWVRIAVKQGAGELLITSIDQDGTKTGFDIELYKTIGSITQVPIIASGGGGSIEDFVELFTETLVDGALAASIFHFNQISINDLKLKLQNQGLEIRL